MGLLCVFAPSLATAGGTGGPLANEHPGWEKSGDVLQWGIPLFGLGLSFLMHPGQVESSFDLLLSDATDGSGLNWPGPRLRRSPWQDFLVSFARMEVATYGLKYSIDAKRPNGGGQSFPSGHSAAAFMGAEFIRKGYGFGWGVPAYLAAGWVGYTRVESHNHYWRDVLGGAAVGIASNYDFDDIETPVGTLNIGLASFTPDMGGHLAVDDPLAVTPFDAPRPIPGLLFELAF
ncbi:PAP2 superfamily protein [Panacagrimonas perspica]|uniref:PAP2 superfamily protein n=1 Tax=Panacagrimonas perspica TaxID=381431 RepID=A0A4R7P4B8_9GAMM|nr:phosphatase PAP2 family protein [Panacagrimonas perspica]TDU28488.1 PAP2 superfamily protein [Panacagrimonas perspica]THD00887.1 hypothetical protein B1810_22570 [Panacagrimonas perspica]